MKSSSEKRLGLAPLSAIVFGSMVGSGIFNIAQNMGAGASVGAVLVSWGITALGMLMLVATFKSLADRRPDLNAGIYQYAQAGFGNYAGFNIAWGYWLCTASGNVAYAVMLNDALGMYFPTLLRHGWPSVALDSALVWGMYSIVVRGIHSASLINTVMTALKLVSLLLIVGLFWAGFDAGLFTSDFWGSGLNLGSVGEQVRSTMLVTLWCFVGIEGAVVMSARARKPGHVGVAGLIGFFSAWVLYVLVSALCYGVLPQPEMAALENPSVAYVLKAVCGPWAYHFVTIAVIVALLGGWMSWTLLCAQVPYEAATVRIMPPSFLRLNRHGAPAFGLLVSTVAMQIFILIVMASEHVYMAAVEITSMMVLPCYLFSGLYLWKASLHGGRELRIERGDYSRKFLVTGVLCTIYCLWLIYAGGLWLLMQTSLFYIPGIFFYIAARRSATPGLKVRGMFTLPEKCIAATLAGCALATLILNLQG